MTTDFNPLHWCLETDRKRLMEELERLKTNGRAVPFGKREEEATELEKRLALEERIKDCLAEAEHALRKFDNGTYGFCDNCGQQIDPARLEALPQANLCLSCKARQPKNATGQRGKESKAQRGVTR